MKEMIEPEIKTLVKLLDEYFKNKLPIKETSAFDLGVLVGQQEVIQYIKEKYKIEEGD